MSNFIVLGSSSSEEWDAYLNQLETKDIYFSSAFFRLFEDGEHQQAELFVFKQGDQLIMYPYLLRSISHLPAVIQLGLDGDWYDISTPYGYGGPISNLLQEPNEVSCTGNSVKRSRITVERKRS